MAHALSIRFTNRYPKNNLCHCKNGSGGPLTNVGKSAAGKLFALGRSFYFREGVRDGRSSGGQSPAQSVVETARADTRLPVILIFDHTVGQLYIPDTQLVDNA